ncbi:MAG: DinB family protein [Candidatus Hinthialibacter antarcticus]|nr:DinB family protein [Candidatus Hinthialibacter antarcticus]
MVQFNSDKDIPALVQEANRLLDEVCAITKDCDDDLWRRRPSEDEWSASECCDHLVQISSKVIPKLQEALQMMKSEQSERPKAYHYSMFERLFVYFASGSDRRPLIRLKSHTDYAPVQSPSIQETITQYQHWQSELIVIMQAVQGKDPTKTKVASPAIDWLKLSVGQWIVLLLVHQNRHILQARRALERVAA